MAEISGGLGKKGSGQGAAAGAGRKEKRGTGKKRGAGTKKGGGREGRSGSTAERGAERLKEAADRKLKKSSGELADLLVGKARAGDMPSLRLLVSLAERHKPTEKVGEKRSVLGPFAEQVREWAAEDPWVDPEEGEVKGEDFGMERGGRTLSGLASSDAD